MVGVITSRSRGYYFAGLEFFPELPERKNIEDKIRDSTKETSRIQIPLDFEEYKERLGVVLLSLSDFIYKYRPENYKISILETDNFKKFNEEAKTLLERADIPSGLIKPYLENYLEMIQEAQILGRALKRRYKKSENNEFSQ